MDTPVRTWACRSRFLEHGSRAEILAAVGLTPSGVAERTMAALGAARTAEPAMAERSAR